MDPRSTPSLRTKKIVTQRANARAATLFHKTISQLQVKGTSARDNNIDTARASRSWHASQTSTDPRGPPQQEVDLATPLSFPLRAGTDLRSTPCLRTKKIVTQRANARVATLFNKPISQSQVKGTSARDNNTDTGRARSARQTNAGPIGPHHQKVALTAPLSSHPQESMNPRSTPRLLKELEIDNQRANARAARLFKKTILKLQVPDTSDRDNNIDTGGDKDETNTDGSDTPLRSPGAFVHTAPRLSDQWTCPHGTFAPGQSRSSSSSYSCSSNLSLSICNSRILHCPACQERELTFALRHSCINSSNGAVVVDAVPLRESLRSLEPHTAPVNHSPHTCYPQPRQGLG
jgi:hypothetical protein